MFLDGLFSICKNIINASGCLAGRALSTMQCWLVTSNNISISLERLLGLLLTSFFFPPPVLSVKKVITKEYGLSFLIPGFISWYNVSVTSQFKCLICSFQILGEDAVSLKVKSYHQENITHQGVYVSAKQVTLIRWDSSFSAQASESWLHIALILLPKRNRCPFQLMLGI